MRPAHNASVPARVTGTAKLGGGSTRSKAYAARGSISVARSAQARGKTIARADYTKVVVMLFTLTPDDMDDAAPSLYVNQLLAFEDRTRQPLCR